MVPWQWQPMTQIGKEEEPFIRICVGQTESQAFNSREKNFPFLSVHPLQKHKLWPNAPETWKTKRKSRWTFSFSLSHDISWWRSCENNFFPISIVAQIESDLFKEGNPEGNCVPRYDVWFNVKNILLRRILLTSEINHFYNCSVSFRIVATTLRVACRSVCASDGKLSIENMSNN